MVKEKAPLKSINTDVIAEVLGGTDGGKLDIWQAQEYVFRWVGVNRSGLYSKVQLVQPSWPKRRKRPKFKRAVLAAKSKSGKRRETSKLWESNNCVYWAAMTGCRRSYSPSNTFMQKEYLSEATMTDKQPNCFLLNGVTYLARFPYKEAILSVIAFVEEMANKAYPMAKLTGTKRRSILVKVLESG